MTTMTKAEFADVMAKYQATWPKTKLNERTLDAWYPTMAEFTAIHAFEALDRLAAEQDLMPMLSQFRRMAVIVRNDLQDTDGPKADPSKDPANYPESAYLKAAKPLIYSPGGAYLLTTAVAELDTEGAGLKAKILDAGGRHREWMDAGHKPTTDMLVELANLGAAVDEWYQPRKDQIEDKKRRDVEAFVARKRDNRQPRPEPRRRKAG